MKDTTPRVRYGIIGCGYFAQKAIIPAIEASRNSELIAIQRRSLEAARATAKSYSIPLAFNNVADLVGHPDVDAVFIASANSQHLPETAAAASAGKHVIVEKPMALNVGEAERMVEICDQRRVHLMVAHMIRFSPLVRRIREIIRSGMLGEVSYARADFIYDARQSRRTWLLDRRIAGGGPVFDIGVHCLDTLRFVLDAEVESVKSQLEPPPTAERTEEVAEIALKFARGVIGSVYCSYRSSFRRRHLEVIGSLGVVAAPDFTMSDARVPLTITLMEGDSPPTVRVENCVVPNLYEKEISHFSECVVEGREPLLSGLNGLHNQRVMDRAMTVS